MAIRILPKSNDNLDNDNDEIKVTLPVNNPKFDAFRESFRKAHRESLEAKEDDTPPWESKPQLHPLVLDQGSGPITLANIELAESRYKEECGIETPDLWRRPDTPRNNSIDDVIEVQQQVNIVTDIAKEIVARQTPDSWLPSSEVADALKHITSDEAITRLKSSTYAFLTGVAGSGKSYTLLQGISSGAITPCIAATTGIAAVNLGTQTINSWLKYFDTFSLKQNRYDGKLKRYIKSLATEYDSLVIDEVSMMDKDQLQVIYDEIAELNFERVAMGKSEFRLLLTGDMAQLPPVPNKDREGKSLPLPWVFQADCWNKFEENTVRLTKVWRQSNPLLLDALNAIRSGNGTLGADLLLKAGVEFTPRIDPTFPGTTLIAKNLEVNKYNQLGLMRVSGETGIATTRSWFSGMKPPSEWKNIPGSHNPELDSLRLKKGAYVMILSNDAPAFNFVNGDCGTIKDWVLDDKGEITSVVVELTRGKEVVVNKIVRDQLSPELPGHINKADVATVKEFDESMGYYEGVVFSERAKRYIVGQIEYLPIRLGYASTVHKSQGLSLPLVQIDISSHFMSSPSMIYVALSRAQTIEGVKIVGNASMLAKKTTTDPLVRRFI